MSRPFTSRPVLLRSLILASYHCLISIYIWFLTLTINQAFYYRCYTMPVFDKLIHLSIESDKENGWQALPRLLLKSPNLQTLAIKVYWSFWQISAHNVFCTFIHVKIICYAFRVFCTKLLIDVETHALALASLRKGTYTNVMKTTVLLLRWKEGVVYRHVESKC